MRSDWKKCKIGDVCSKAYSGGTPLKSHREYFEGGNIPWLNTGEVSFNRIRRTENFITDLGLANSSARWVPVNSVIVAMYASPTAGKVAISKIELTTNQACCNLLVDEKIADYRYVYYFLKNKYTHLTSLANGGAQQNLSVGVIKDFDLELPSLETQRKIASVLSSLDDKIELNDRINANLEEQAKAIFEEMFSDGVATKGILSNIAEVIMGQSPEGSSYNEDKNGTVFFQGRTDFGPRFPKIRMYTTGPKRMAKKNDVLLSVRAPVGDLNIAHEDCCIGRGLSAIRSKDNHQSFVYYTMLSLKQKLKVFDGEGTVFGCVNKASLNSLPISLPPKERIDEFENVAASIDAKILCNYEENLRLSSLRDALLPRLLSGELDVSNLTI